jgi:hypothetical protein
MAVERLSVVIENRMSLAVQILAVEKRESHHGSAAD